MKGFKRYKKGTISIEFLFVFIFLIFIFLILWVKMQEINEKNEVYIEEVNIEKVSLLLLSKLNMASYSEGYESNFKFFPDDLNNYTITIESTYILSSSNQKDYFFKFNNMELVLNNEGVFENPPFILEPAEYLIKHDNGVVYIEKI